MFKLRNSLADITGLLVVVLAVALITPHTSHSQGRSHSDPPGQERELETEIVALVEGLTQQQDASAEHRADPCEHVPPGHAYGRTKRCPPQDSSAGIARGDYNGDGIGDIAVGVPFEDVGSVADAGAVNIIYGSNGGLTATSNQFWTQDSADHFGDILDQAEAGDQFGIALAAGDFNGDGFSDLAIGARGEDIGSGLRTRADVGAVNVLYGSAIGLTAAGNQFWTQDSPDVLDVAEANDKFGLALGWGDFNGDSIGDLVVGVAFEDVGTITDAGAVNVIYGSASGLTAADNQFWTQDSADAFGFTIHDHAEATDRFGSVLTAGDFDGNGASDLAIGVIGESTSASQEGAVNVIYGFGNGLLGIGNQAFDNTLSGDRTLDQFGGALAAGDFDGDGFADLAIGAPLKEVGSIDQAGAVVIEYGTGNGLLRIGEQLWTQDSPDVLDAAEAFDEFGFALAAGDFNGDGKKDLAVGVPFEDNEISHLVDLWAVNILYGSSSGLTGTGGSLLTVAGASDTLYGRALTAWNFGNGAQADLAIGMPFRDLGTLTDAGAVIVLYGSVSGLTNAGSQLWTQDSPGILDSAEAGDQFGRALY
jgi:hypothetical protein